MRFDLRPLRLTTGWSEPNAVVSRTLSVHTLHGSNTRVRFLFFFLFFKHLYFSLERIHHSYAHISRAPPSTQIFHITQINAFESRLFPFSIISFFSHASILFALPLPTHTSHISKRTSSNPRPYIFFIFFT